MRTRTWVLAGVATAAAVAGASGYAMYEWQARPELESVSPTPGTTLRTSSASLEIRVTNPARVKDLRVMLDDRNVTSLAKRQGSGFVVPLTGIPDGDHLIRFQAADGTVYGGTLRQEWRFTSDTTRPALRVDAAAAKWTTARGLAGTSEPGAQIVVAWKGGVLRTTADAAGRWTVDPQVRPGSTAVRVTAFDAAGNRAVSKRVVRYDAAPPRIRPGFGNWVTKPGPVTLTATVRDTSPVTVSATLSGKPVAAKLADGTLTLPLGDLVQGTYVLDVIAKDAAGNTTHYHRPIGIDLTDDISKDLPMTLGARGKDVSDLARRLAFDGFLTVPKGRHLPTRFDVPLAKAVTAFQAKYGLPRTGIADRQVLDLSRGELIATKSAFHVQVVLNGRVAATFPIAIGQPAYPTPTGDYNIIDMQKNPTWFPPDSPWAKGLEPIPPGGGNPLGTRWMGTSAPAVGFHGTPEDWSVGTAASHGCMRMHIPDAEALYDMIWMGMRVKIQA